MAYKELKCERCGVGFYVARRPGRYPRVCSEDCRSSEDVTREGRAAATFRMLGDVAGAEGIEWVAPVLAEVVEAALEVGAPDRLDLRRAVTFVATAKGPTAFRRALIVLAATALAMGARVPRSTAQGGMHHSADRLHKAA